MDSKGSGKLRVTIKRLALAVTIGFACSACQISESHHQAIEVTGFSDVIKHWNDQNHRDPQPRYALHQIRSIADNILRYQRANGRWPAPLLADEYKAWQQKHAADGTNTQ